MDFLFPWPDGLGLGNRIKRMPIEERNHHDDPGQPSPPTQRLIAGHVLAEPVNCPPQGRAGDSPQRGDRKVSGMESHLDVSRLLQELGDTPDAVAAKLSNKKVQGVRNAARYLNPIVRYVQVCFQDDTMDMDVIKSGVLSVHLRSAPTQEVAIPETVRQFMDAFNRGGYPNLELPPAS
jgi:hypothetical protein